MIKNLTKTEKAKIPKYIKKWIDLAPQPIDRTKIKKIIKKIYKEDKLIIIADSIQNLFGLIKIATKGKKLEYNILGSQLGSQLRGQLRGQLGSQLSSQQ